jgi:hypothetical protein
MCSMENVSVSIDRAIGCVLDDLGLIPGRVGDLYLYCNIWIDCGPHPVSYQTCIYMGGGLPSGLMLPVHEGGHFHLMLGLRMCGASPRYSLTFSQHYA